MKRRKEQCEWCCEDIDPHSKKTVNVGFGVCCNAICAFAEGAFRYMYSDEEYNRKEHYAYLTRGE